MKTVEAAGSAFSPGRSAALGRLTKGLLWGRQQHPPDGSCANASTRACVYVPTSVHVHAEGRVFSKGKC